ncbi:MAG: hypothetical protein V3T23_03535, partial [Nitrososphaerales archaeon]
YPFVCLLGLESHCQSYEGIYHPPTNIVSLETEVINIDQSLDQRGPLCPMPIINTAKAIAGASAFLGWASRPDTITLM